MRSREFVIDTTTRGEIEYRATGTVGPFLPKYLLFVVAILRPSNGSLEKISCRRPVGGFVSNNDRVVADSKPVTTSVSLYDMFMAVVIGRLE